MNYRINQSVCRWCWKNVSLPDLAAASARFGLKGIDLLSPEEWAPLAQHGLICTMTTDCGGSIPAGLNRVENHARILDKLRTRIEQTADAGFPHVICFSGNRHQNGQLLSDEEGLKNCAAAIKQVVGLAERRGVTICIELLNSKVDHKDYMCDRTSWGVELVKSVGSANFKLLYDIYHAQIMEGDVIRTLRDNIDYIGHVHTGGVPGRHEIDETQEVNYPAVMRALADLNYRGYVAQEFIPAGPDPLASLEAAVRLCDV
jgi:hydroxypyruvate isomerase